MVGSSLVKQTGEAEVQCYFVKGMLEGVLDHCGSYTGRKAGAAGDCAPVVLSDMEVGVAPTLSAPNTTLSSHFFQLKSPIASLPNQRHRVIEAARAMANSGLRVLALAHGTQMNSLTLDGIVGMSDPPRRGVSRLTQ